MKLSHVYITFMSKELLSVITITGDVLFSVGAQWGMYFLQCNDHDTLLQWYTVCLCKENPPPTTLVHYKWKWQPSFYIKVMNHLQMLITTQWTSPGFDSQYTLVTIKHMLPHNPNSLKCAIVLFLYLVFFVFLIHCSS